MSGCSKSTASSRNGDNNDSDQRSGDSNSTHKSLGYMPDQQGTVLTYTIVSGDEIGNSARIDYIDIHDSAGYRVAAAEAVVAGIKLYPSARYNEEYTYSTSYFATAYFDALQLLASTFNSFTHQETPLTMKLPHKDALHKVAFPTTVTATWHGVKDEDGTVTDSKMKQTVQEGVIDSSAVIQTAAGTYKDCIRVHYLKSQQRIISISSPDGDYTVDNTAHFDIMVWMAKGVGAVKTVEVNLDTGIQTVTDLTKIEQPGNAD
jgi:hypothetical protein